MRSTWTLAIFGTSVLSWTIGCQQTPGTPSAGKTSETQKPGNEHDHHHPSRGPHGGDLIELGDEEYHAEFVHDDMTGSVSIYILDSSANKPVAIDAKDVTVNLLHDGQPEQYALAAEPQEGDEQDKASHFASKMNKALSHAIEEKGARARLQVTIGGKAYTGDIVHIHDHGEHDHKHDHRDDEGKK
jgi:hypothetical protein